MKILSCEVRIKVASVPRIGFPVILQVDNAAARVSDAGWGRGDNQASCFVKNRLPVPIQNSSLYAREKNCSTGMTPLVHPLFQVELFRVLHSSIS